MKKETLQKWKELLLREYEKGSLNSQIIIQGLVTFSAIFFGIWTGQVFSTKPEVIPWYVLIVIVILGIGFYLLHKRIELQGQKINSTHDAIQLLTAAIYDFETKKNDEGFMKNVETTSIAELKKYDSTKFLI